MTKTGTALLSEERYVSSDGSTLAYEDTISGWMCSAALKHFRGVRKQAGRSFCFVSKAVVVVGGGEEVLTLNLHGRTDKSEDITQTITARVRTFNRCIDDIVLALFGSIDPRRVLRISCICAQYISYGRSLCRHGMWSLLTLADERLIPLGRISITRALIPDCDSLRVGYEAAREVLEERANARRRCAANVLTQTGTTVPPPIITARTATDAKTAVFS